MNKNNDFYKQYFTLVEQSKILREDNWLKSHWRPISAYVYLLICFMDFIGFPLLTMVLPTWLNLPYTPWKSLTLEGGGLIHMAFGAILGVSAWTRGSEKVAGINLMRQVPMDSYSVERTDESISPSRNIRYGGNNEVKNSSYFRSHEKIENRPIDDNYVPRGRPDPNEGPQ